MKNQANHLLRITAALLVFGCASFTVTAATPSGPRELLMSFNETLDSSSTLDGNITLTGAFSGRGTRHEDFTVIRVSNDGSRVVVGGTSTITVSDGTITTQFTGTIYFDNATFPTTQLAYIRGVESITGGTGAYAGATGDGTFGATLDYTNGNVIGCFLAKVQVGP